jgi:GAF domain-containing protein/anti-sigma regulatory factor (Ser/Thr protein kinase)
MTDRLQASAPQAGGSRDLRSLVLPADLGEVGAVRSLVAELGEELGFPPERVFDIQVAVSEATANAIEHSRQAGEVTVEAEAFADRLEVRVLGVGEFHLPSAAGNREHRGLGLPLMAKLSDHLALYSGAEGGTLVSLTFYRPGACPTPSPLPPSLVELLAEHSLFDQLLDNLPDPFIVCDQGWRVVYVNDRAVAESRTEREDLLGEVLWEHLPVIDPRVSREHELALQERLSLSLVSHDPAEDRWWEARLFPVPEGVAILARDITEARRSDLRIRADSAVRAGVARIFSEALSARTEQELGEVCLRVAQEVTGSRLGFIAEFGPDGTLRDLSISNPGWEACTVEATGHRGEARELRVHGLYGRVLLDGRPLLTDAPSGHPDSAGLPGGHPPLNSFLGVPLLKGEEVTGLIAVANPRGRYDSQHVESLEALASAAVEAFSRKRAEESLKHTAQRLELLSWTAGRLLAADEPQAIVEELCLRVLEFLDCQVFINFLVIPGEQRMRLNASAGLSEETARAIEYLDFGEAVSGWVAVTGLCRIEEAILDSDDAITDLVRPMGIRAYACHPLLSRGRVIGTLSFAARDRDRFAAEDLAVMKAVAAQVAIAVERGMTEESLRTTTEELELGRRTAETSAARTRRLSDALSELDLAVLRAGDFDELMQTVVSRGCLALEADSAAISLRKDDRWLVSYVEGVDSGFIGSEMDDRQEAHALLALRSREVVPVDDVLSDGRVDREHVLRWGIRSVMVAPLIGAQEALGVIFFNHTASPHSFSTEEIDFARKLAGTASFAAERLPR